MRYFLLLSLLVHLLFLSGVASVPRPDVSLSKEVEVTIVKSPYQIADIQPPDKEERPEKAKFLGIYDSRVDQERVAVTRRSSGGGNSEREPEKKVEEQKNNREGEGPKLASKTPTGLIPGPISDELADSLPEDFYPDYKIGDRTYLNVLRFPKIGYFVRLKKIFKTTFNPVPAIRPYFLSNQVSRGQVEVVLAVSVDRRGNLSELIVLNSSGLDLYDKEAIRTIRDSSPFAAPPADLLDQSSHLRMVWTFTVYL